VTRGPRAPKGKQPRIHEVTIERASHTGAGVATIAGEAVLVAGALVGERVRVSREGRARARLLEVLTASAARVEPPCPYARSCGGCDLMHAALSAQEQLVVHAALEQLGHALGGGALPEPELLRPSAALGYRSRARLHVEASARDVAVGYREGRSHRLAAVDRCLVLRPELDAALRALRELLAGSSGRGEAQVALGAAARLVIDLHFEGTLAAAAFARADAWVASGRLAGVRLWAAGATAPASFGDARALIAGADGLPLWIAPGGFAQPSDEGASALARRAGELCAAQPEARPGSSRVVELFAGSGTLTVAARPTAARYVAVEQSAEAATALRDNLAARGWADTKVVVADADAFAIPGETTTVLLDPPRSGAAGACAQIARARPKQVIYVSCNPATLARDLAMMARAGYRLATLALVHLFPQTSQLEAIAQLVRGG
jgi:23S rRNA (uracil1939-C5)-methyltransferase